MGMDWSKIENRVIKDAKCMSKLNGRHDLKLYDDYVRECDAILESEFIYSIMLWWKTAEKHMWEIYENLLASGRNSIAVQYAIMCGAVKEYVTDAVENHFDWDEILDWDKLGTHEHDRR